ncbi:Protein kinase-like domain containing protein [Elaphomyces granulatus]
MGTSPPPTPPRMPEYDERRFKDITTHCEWIEDYHPGGYHPVHFGDVFKDGQYKVNRKLGEGSFSTVWLAFDQKFHRYVALKIAVASMSKTSNELMILQRLAAATSTKVKPVTELLDKFDHEGPNGVHLCLVFEPMGPSVNSMVEELPCFNPRYEHMNVRYPFWMAKRILRQALQGLEFLHRNGIAHGDFQPGNMLFTLQDLNHIGNDKLQQDENYKFGSKSSPVERLDGKVDKWAPKYLAVPQPLAELADISDNFTIKLSDMGGGKHTPIQLALSQIKCSYHHLFQ